MDLLGLEGDQIFTPAQLLQDLGPGAELAAQLRQGYFRQLAHGLDAQLFQGVQFVQGQAVQGDALQKARCLLRGNHPLPAAEVVRG